MPFKNLAKIFNFNVFSSIMLFIYKQIISHSEGSHFLFFTYLKATHF